LDLGLVGNSATITIADDQAAALNVVDAGDANDYLTIVSTDAQREVVINEDGADIDFRVEATGEVNALFLRGSDGTVGIGTNAQTANLQIRKDQNANTLIAIQNDTAGAAARAYIQFFSNSNNALVGVADDGYAAVADWADTLFFNSNNGLGIRWAINSVTQMAMDANGDVGIGVTSPNAQLHVDQPSATGAQPVLLLDQGDVSEEMIEFACTIGVGNALEAVGGKTLTVTHFIKISLPGALTRYLPCGTIA
jgi:hypothetical protein